MSSAGQWIGGVGGAIVGAFLGGPVGAVYGAQIGLTAGTLIDPPKGPDMQGPRLDDLTQQTSTYGAKLGRIHGTCGVTGNIIWLENNKLKEVAFTEDVGGKGGPTATQTTYEYYATFAVALCEGPIAGVKRIWLGPNLFYDPSSINELAPEPDGILGGLVWHVMASERNRQKFRVYLGTAAQDPDPRIEAQFGTGNAPAYRNTAYIVFEDLPLKDFGNTLPKVTVEVVKDSTEGPEPFYSYTYPADQRVTSLNLMDENGLTQLVEREHYEDGGQEYNRIFLSTYSGDERQGGRILDDDYPTSIYDSEGNPYTIIPGQTVAMQWVAGVRTGPSYAYIRTSLGSFTYDMYADRPVQVAEAGAWMVIGARQTLDFAYLYAVAGRDFAGKITVHNAARLTLTDSGRLYAATATGLDIYQAFPDGLTFVESVVLDYSGMASAGESRQYLDGSKLWVATIGLSDMHLRSFNVADWSVADDFTFTGKGYANGDIINISVRDGVFAVMHASFTEASAPEPTIDVYNLNALVDYPVPLADIIEAECLRSGLIELSDLDTSLLTEDVSGYRVAGGGSLRAVLDPLQGAYLFDVVQSGYGLKFVPRGNASARTIQWQDLVPTGAGVQIEHETEMDSQIPARVSVRHLDKTRDYDVNEQYADRLGTDSVKKTDIDLPIVLTPTQAAQLSEKLVHMYWLERDSFKVNLPPVHLDLEPSDIITLEAEHATFEMRLTEIDYREDGVLECKARASDEATYSSTATGIDGVPGDSLLPLSGQTKFRLIDIPVILEQQNTSGFTLVMAGHTDGWPGGVLLRSPAGQVWTQLASMSSPCTFGYASEALEENPGTLLDRGSSLTVSLNGSLASVSEGDMLDGANYCAYGAPGRWEILRFANASLNADGSYTLTVFKRGDRGTEWATGLHEPGDTFIFLDDPSTAFVGTPQDLIGIERLYRGVTAGEDIDSATDTAYTYSGTNLKPLSGVHPSHEIDGGDVEVSWVRRTRFGGAWRDFVDATLSEAAESYEIDVIDTSDGSVLRTITAATTAFTYTASQMTADFGGAPAEVKFAIYQMSEVVGRGQVLEHTAKLAISVVSAGSMIIDESVTEITVPIPTDSIITDVYVWTMHREALTVPAGWTLVDSETVSGSGFIQTLSILHRAAGPLDVTLTQASSGRFLGVAVGVCAPNGPITETTNSQNIGPTSGAHNGATTVAPADGIAIGGSCAILAPTSGSASYTTDWDQLTDTSVANNRLCVGHTSAVSSASMTPQFTHVAGSNYFAEITLILTE